MQPDFQKSNGLIPVIIQHVHTRQVLMLGYMNEAAWAKTQAEQRVTFYSRSKQRLWTKGETSGNYFDLHSARLDCDDDTLLLQVLPHGPACHRGTTSCFAEDTARGTLYKLQHTIDQRLKGEAENSYTRQLFERGINKMAQKVGEEAVELVIEAKDDNAELFKNEAADLLYHLVLLLRAKGSRLEEIEQVLQDRERE